MSGINLILRMGWGEGGGVVFCGVRGERTENLEVCAPRREPTARPVKGRFVCLFVCLFVLKIILLSNA